MFVGHIHNDRGLIYKNNINYVNAAICTERYQPTNPPIIFTI